MDKQKVLMDIRNLVEKADSGSLPSGTFDALITDWFLTVSDETANKLVGEIVANSYRTANRMGFMRISLAKQELCPGRGATVRVREVPRTVVLATSVHNSMELVLQDKLLSPSEYPMTAGAFLSTSESYRSVEDMVADLDEQLYVSEDRIFIRCMQRKTPHPYTTTVETLKALLMGVKSPMNCFIGSNVWLRMVADEWCRDRLTPNASYELLNTGMLGRIKVGEHRVNVFSDVYRPPTHKVLNRDDIFVTGDPIALGQYTDRKGYEGTAMTKVIDEVEFRGIHVDTFQSMALMSMDHWAWASKD